MRGVATLIAKRAPTGTKLTVRALRHARRAAFEAVGSDRYSAVALAGMDRALAGMLGPNGVFLEAGANDGIRQSNTYLLERFYDWRGVLVEAIPTLARQAARHRPTAHVVNAALTEPGAPAVVMMCDRDLTSKVTGDGTVAVPARTISDVLDEAGVERLDLLSLDVEGHEEQALAGLDLDRHAARYILIEVWAPKKRCPVIEGELLRGRYEPVRWFTDHDVLYRRRGEWFSDDRARRRQPAERPKSGLLYE